MTEGQSLRSRVPGQSAMGKLVARQRGVAAGSRLARILGRSPLAPENRKLYRAAVGEMLVGNALDRLGPAWDVLHAVPVGVGHREIDHLAIGPLGVFTLVTRDHSGQDVVVDGDRILVDGRPHDYIAHARAEAEGAAARLSAAARQPVHVEPVIVCVNARKLAVRRAPAAVTVVSAANLERFFARLERRLDGPTVAYISDVADRGRTWQTPPNPEQDTLELHDQFARLRAELAVAARRRALWVALAFILACALTWGSVALVVARIIRP